MALPMASYAWIYIWWLDRPKVQSSNNLISCNVVWFFTITIKEHNKVFFFFCPLEISPCGHFKTSTALECLTGFLKHHIHFLINWLQIVCTALGPKRRFQWRELIPEEAAVFNYCRLRICMLTRINNFGNAKSDLVNLRNHRSTGLLTRVKYCRSGSTLVRARINGCWLQNW